MTPRIRRFTADEIAAHEAKLGPDYCAVLRAAISGASYKDMAGMLNLAVGTVKSRLSRARVMIAGLIVNSRQ